MWKNFKQFIAHDFPAGNKKPGSHDGLPGGMNHEVFK
jgi:hypothetical protein